MKKVGQCGSKKIPFRMIYVDTKIFFQKTTQQLRSEATSMQKLLNVARIRPKAFRNDI